jgi:hypothetical protein
MSNLPRIPRYPAMFDDYISRTDNLQVSTDSITGTKKYEFFNWTQAESEQWTAFRIESNLLYALLSDPDKMGPAIRKKMKILIKQVRAYDNNKITGHHLLDKISMSRNLDDCITFNVKRGTELAGSHGHRNPEAAKITPNCSFKKFDIGIQIISVINPENPSSKALPAGMAFAKVYRCISAESPTKLSQYELIGNAKRGVFVSRFDNIIRPEGKSLRAYYYARYESKKGHLGDPGNIISADIM